MSILIISILWVVFLTRNLKNFINPKNNPAALKLGASSDIYLAKAIDTANKFAMCLQLILEDKPGFFTSSSVKSEREKVILHSHANLLRIKSNLDAVPKHLRDGAEAARVMSNLRGKGMR